MAQDHALPENDDEEDLDEVPEGSSDVAAQPAPEGGLGLSLLWHWPEDGGKGQGVTCMAWNQVSLPDPVHPANASATMSSVTPSMEVLWSAAPGRSIVEKINLCMRY